MKLGPATLGATKQASSEVSLCARAYCEGGAAFNLHAVKVYGWKWRGFWHPLLVQPLDGSARGIRCTLKQRRSSPYGATRRKSVCSVHIVRGRGQAAHHADEF